MDNKIDLSLGLSVTNSQPKSARPKFSNTSSGFESRKRFEAEWYCTHNHSNHKKRKHRNFFTDPIAEAEKISYNQGQETEKSHSNIYHKKKLPQMRNNGLNAIEEVQTLKDSDLDGSLKVAKSIQPLNPIDGSTSFEIIDFHQKNKGEALKTGKHQNKTKLFNMKQEFFLAGLSEIEHTEKIWGFILGVSQYLASLEDQMLKLENDEIISQLNKKLKNKIGGKLPQGTLDSNHIDENLSNFSHILWFINLRLLRTLGKVVDAEEHFLFYMWILALFEDENISSLISILENEKEGKMETITHEDHPLNLLVQSITSKHNSEPFYFFERTYRDKRPSKKNSYTISYGEMSKKQLLMTKTIVCLLASYYQATNSTKWEKIFRDNKGFLNHLERIQTSFIYSRLKFQEGKSEKMSSSHLLPWKPKFDIGIQTENIEWTKYFSMKSTANSDMLLKNASDYKDQPKQSSITELITPPFNENITMAFNRWNDIIKMVFIHDIHTTATRKLCMNKYRSEIQNWHQNHLYKFEDTDNSTEKTNQVVILNEMERFLELMWGLNSLLIQSFGYRADDPLCLEEQENLQREFYCILNLSQSLDESKFENKLKQERNDKGQDFKLQKLIILSLKTYRNRKLYQSEAPCQRESFTEEGLKAMAAIAMMSHYYQKVNPEKWATIFVNESNFIKSFENIHSGIMNGLHYSKNFLKEGANNLFICRLIPWKNPFSTNKSQRRSIDRLVG
ncbi:hypothetical protein PGT21_031877 [Puccinia graminis f. sp. tritici]|uniref:Uncharacterized protein n=1 Tax=Puccinia graminis f. sp. tritici TaxID=56615 RepID=A0A5B0Q4C7_PUCGR|nr:hypothetical protein PGT21_031877 [Puccinia graminis f. sp. tritici]KAA1107927.1 hypothetical protein PGTUg99_011472 [Puccinia graminis f. sp. tritici]